MAAPGAAGMAIAVPQGQYSHAILTRELPQQDVSTLDTIHQGIINMVTPMQAMPWKTLVRGLLKLSEYFMPVNYLLPTAASERCLKDHLHAVLTTVSRHRSALTWTGRPILDGPMCAISDSALMQILQRRSTVCWRSRLGAQ